MCSNNIRNVQESTTILDACTKKAWTLIEFTTYIYIYNCPIVVEDDPKLSNQ